MREQPIVRLEHLPSELIVEILKEIDWDDLLSVRKTCKRFSDLSRALPVWKHLFLSDAARSIRPHPRLERPLEHYASTELEHLILRWKSADIGWLKDAKPPARQRAITLQVFQSRPFHLIEGGRWALFATTAGSVEYVDLDSSDLVERNLIPMQTSGSSTTVAVSINYDAPLLTFDLALLMSTRSYDLLQVWRVSLTLDEGRRGTGLSAQRLASFTPQPGRPLEGIAIGGPYLAYHFWLENHDPETWLVVVNWQETLGQETEAEPLSNYPVRIVNYRLLERVNAVYILPGHRLFISTMIRQLLFDIQSVPKLETFQIPPTATIPALAVVTNSYTISRPFVFPGTVRFVLVDDDGLIQGLNINLSGATPDSEILSLMSAPMNILRGVVPVLGHNRCVSTRRNGGIVILNYSWPKEIQDEGSPPVVIKYFSREDWSGRVRGVDECSGRILLEPFILSKAVIALDIALMYRGVF